ncbi:MAG: PilZ domain-containing protein [Hyphomicrobiales bacterium]|nr:PilZ domain-containing protein [Hyphomicrobiales bacterium]MDE1973611.1 PilZ domain-containing protein [Hyphomicrobiales bacterium]MDE2285680.1 PilZ domain-containing protein [Hyphomicrobiales bacterium]MDE2375442.1 PilZ domain-containing protein [Hyphomicrobiales bacterium]
MRKRRRRPFNYAAKVVVDQSEQRPCTISDVSQTGARVVLEKDEPLPDRFLLLLSRNGGPQRRCRIVWRTGVSVGVEFTAD